VATPRVTSDAPQHFAYRSFTGEIVGAGQAVVLIHGLASSRHIWDLVVPRLVETFTVVTLDLPGHGESDQRDGPYDFPSLRDGLLDLFRYLALDRPAVVGHSWGASIALELAASSYPLSRLVLVDGGYAAFRLLPGMTWEVILHHLSPPRLSVPEDEYLAMMREMFAEKWRPEFTPIVLANMKVIDGRVSARLDRPSHLAILEAMWDQDLPALYRAVRVPTLLLIAGLDGPGTLDWPELKERAIPVLRDTIGGALQVITMPDTVHDIPLQRPDELADALIAFLTAR
jgi:pimeloyl-ACP methyl ester carboxylesterase